MGAMKGALMSLIEQRNKFMAFAFAGADLLVELDKDAKVRFATGASSALGYPQCTDMQGMDFSQTLAAEDRSLLLHLIDNVAPGNRFGPVMLSGQEDQSINPVHVCGCRLPEDESLYLSISYESKSGPAIARAGRDTKTGLVEREDFEGVVTEALASAQENGHDVKVSLVSLEGQDQLVERMGSAQGEAFLGKAGAALRSASFADAAAHLENGKYSIVHMADTDVDAVLREIETVSQEMDPEKCGLKAEADTVDIDKEAGAKDVAGALMFAVNQFVTADIHQLGPEAIGGALAALMKETGSRMSEFRSAIADQRIRYFHQPIVDLQTQDIHHHEVLVRFEEHKSPFEMVRFAEETGVIMELDAAILKKAISFLSGQSGPTQKNLAINVSGRSLSSARFTANLYSSLTKINFPKSRLMIEITESSIIQDLEQAERIIQKIRKLGHKVCLDDFGAGAASFQYIRALTVDYIKIDGAYVRTALKRKKEAMLLKAISSLAHDLDIRTIAESIETEEQRAMLKKLGVDQGQGYLFGKPSALVAEERQKQAS